MSTAERVEEWVAEAERRARAARLSGDPEELARDHRRRFENLVWEQRRWASELAELLGEVEQARTFTTDGHRGLIAWCRAGSSCSTAQAARWRRVARVCAAIPEVAEALAEGRIGVEQVEELGRVHANPRVRHLLAEYIEALLADARQSSFEQFRSTLRQWERLLDDDGPQPRGERADRTRGALFESDAFSTRISAVFGNVDGAEMREIFERYCDAEFRTDCDAARREWGEDGCLGHLPRTARQRAADALHRLFLDAAHRDPNASGGVGDPLLSVTVDLATFERLLADLAARAADDPSLTDVIDTLLDDEIADELDDQTADDDEIDNDETDAGEIDDETEAGDGDAGDVDAGDAGDAGDVSGAATAGCGEPAEVSGIERVRRARESARAALVARRRRPGRRRPGRRRAASAARTSPPEPVERSPDPRWWRCCAPGGTPLPRAAALEAMLLGHVRRVVVDPAGVVVDAGRRRRLFTGIQRELVMQIAHWCTHPGCTVPARHCQADHTIDHRHGGITSTHNAGPRCGHHNRQKNHGYAVWLDPDGRWHTYRPDGSEIPFC